MIYITQNIIIIVIPLRRHTTLIVHNFILYNKRGGI